MTVANSKISFRNFPIFLKLSVVWIYLISLNYFLDAVAGLISGIQLELGSLVAGFVYFGLANGLVVRQNSSRIWTIFWVSIGSLVRIYLLVIMVIKDFEPTGTWHFFSYETPVTKAHSFILLGINLLINAGVIFTLLRPEIKQMFSLQTTQQEAT